jgi:hypothetical protein
MLIGHTRSMISRLLYEKIRVILALCDMHLPAWATVRDSRARINQLLGSKIRTAESVFDTPCYALSAKRLISEVCDGSLCCPRLDVLIDILFAG